MSWIESHDTLADHPKLLDLAEILSVSENECIGILHRLWWWSLQNVAETGDLSRFRPTVIERATRFAGPPGKLLPSLVAAGFLDPNLCVHDWQDFGGRLGSRRAANRERSRAAYQKKHGGKPVENSPLRVDFAKSTGLPYPTRPYPTEDEAARRRAAPPRSSSSSSADGEIGGKSRIESILDPAEGEAVGVDEAEAVGIRQEPAENRLETSTPTVDPPSTPSRRINEPRASGRTVQSLEDLIDRGIFAEMSERFPDLSPDRIADLLESAARVYVAKKIERTEAGARKWIVNFFLAEIGDSQEAGTSSRRDPAEAERERVSRLRPSAKEAADILAAVAGRRSSNAD